MPNHNEQWTETTAQVAAAFRAAPLQQTEDCLEPDAFFVLIEDARDDPAFLNAKSHLAECAFCRREFIRMRRAQLEADTLHTQIAASTVTPVIKPAAEAPSRTQRDSLREAWRRWLAWPALRPVPAFACTLLIGVVALQGTRLRRLEAERTEWQAITVRRQQMPGLQAQQFASRTTADVLPAIGQAEAVSKAFDKPVPKPDNQNALVAKRDTGQNQVRVQKMQNAALAAKDAALVRSNRLPTKDPQSAGSVSAAAISKQMPQKIEGIGLESAAFHSSLAALPTLSKLNASHQMGGNEPVAPTVTLVYPTDGERISKTRVVFRWKLVDGVDHYKFRLNDDKQGKPIVVKNDVRGVTEYAPEKPLLPGRSYRWQVIACFLDAARQPRQQSAIFETLDARFATRLRGEQARRMASARKQAEADWRDAENLNKRGAFAEAEPFYRLIPPVSPHYAEAQKRLQAPPDPSAP